MEDIDPGQSRHKKTKQVYSHISFKQELNIKVERVTRFAPGVGELVYNLSDESVVRYVRRDAGRIANRVVAVYERRIAP
jgi:hypothetical protein